MSVPVSLPPTTQAHLDGVRRYYEQNTRLFMALGNDRAMHTIHRALWPEGVHDLESALNYSSELILSEIRAYEREHPSQALTVLDLGCGVGGSLFYLARHLPTTARLIGLTLSPIQAQLAGRSAQRLGLQSASWFVEADFLHLPVSVAADVAFSIEAFAHAADPARFFEQAARILKPGGRLLLLDDFIAEEFAKPPAYDWAGEFQRGWHLPKLDRASHMLELARRYSLRWTANIDLTPCLRLRAWPDLLAASLLTVARRWPTQPPIVSSLLGSLAQQNGFKHGQLAYRWLAFERGS